ncbi:Cytochrome 82A4 [Capsicum baccatum]|uniref:Cytochrome 82A4 n=1 Tax=Capsicum baccatum TaxID=33114 RepID=A0A2G2VIX6_CAPBA|nr:Cytochrome 82A4 [Capsicum baccatum]
MRKSVAKAATPFSAGACTNTGEALAVIIDRLSPLAYKYGPIFTFRLGIPRVLVVSSYDAVKDCLNINDKVFAARPRILVGEYIGYNNAMLFLASYGDYWRKIRKIVINEVLSSSKLEKLRDVRISEVKTSIKDLYSLFPITGDQNLDFPVTGDHFPVTRDNFPVGGDDISFIVDGENVIKSKKQPLTETQGKDSYNKVFLFDPSLDPTHGVSFSAKGDKVIKSWKQPAVEMQGKALYNSAHSE